MSVKKFEGQCMQEGLRGNAYAGKPVEQLITVAKTVTVTVIITITMTETITRGSGRSGQRDACATGRATDVFKGPKADAPKSTAAPKSTKAPESTGTLDSRGTPPTTPP
eukprot:364855-Chlamydomonas_euryale.AAC.8